MAVNVPRVPGVPNVVFAAAGQILTLLTRDAIGIFRGAPSAPWGLYQGGRPVIVADTVVAFDYRQQWALADFPIERGSFESYNKVATPFSTGFRFAMGGSDARRTALLNSIARIAGNTQLYSVVTPTAVYLNVNVSRYNYSVKSNDGVGLLHVDVFVEEVRQAAGAAFSNTKSPSSAAQANTGPVQPTAATGPQAARSPQGSGSFV